MKTIIEELLEAECVKGLKAGARSYPTEGHSLCPACPTLSCPVPAPCPSSSTNTTSPTKASKKSTLEIESAKCGNMVKFQLHL